MTPLLASSSPVLWFTTRATGTVAVVLLTASVVLGILTTTRASAPGVPRFALSELHRRVAIEACCFLGLHVLTAVADTYVPIGWFAAVVPFVSSYRPFWVGLGAVAFDLVLAVMVTGLFRRQFGPRLFRVVHWAVYLSWPLAIAHGVGIGTDLRFGWMDVVLGVCVAAVVAAVAWRLWADPYPGDLRTAAPRRPWRSARFGMVPRPMTASVSRSVEAGPRRPVP
jgi:predicted ferric reductase